MACGQGSRNILVTTVKSGRYYTKKPNDKASDKCTEREERVLAASGGEARERERENGD